MVDICKILTNIRAIPRKFLKIRKEKRQGGKEEEARQKGKRTLKKQREKEKENNGKLLFHCLSHKNVVGIRM